MMSEEKVASIFGEVGSQYGFSSVSATFINDPDLKISWIRTGRSIQFRVSDYLRNAPEFAIYSLADSTFQRMTSDPTVQYGKDFTDYLGSKQFLEDNRILYKGRNRGFHQPDQRLMDSIARLQEKGLIQNVGNDVEIFYHDNIPKERPKQSAGKGSPIFKIIMVNSKLKDVKDQDAYDYGVFKAVAQEQCGYGDREKYEEMMQAYPNAELHEVQLISQHQLYNKKPKESLKVILMRKVKP